MTPCRNHRACRDTVGQLVSEERLRTPPAPHTQQPTVFSARNEFFEQVDLMATLAEAAGTPLPLGTSTDGGTELAAVLQPATAPAKRNAGLWQGSKGRVLRQGDFRNRVRWAILRPSLRSPFGPPYGNPDLSNPMKRPSQLALMLLLASFVMLHAEETKQASVEQLVVETHAASLKLREAALRSTIAKDSCWPAGIWGENLWCLAALCLNEKLDEANSRLLKRANEFLAAKPANVPATSPERPGNLPWTFFSVTDYVRTLHLFHAKSRHFPGRLKPETEAAMKESLWLWVSGESRLADIGLDDLFLLLGTENHDLNRRPSYYLVTALLNEDPAYRDRKLADGHTTAEHAAAYTKFYREWRTSRAKSGLWVEVG